MVTPSRPLLLRLRLPLPLPLRRPLRLRLRLRLKESPYDLHNRRPRRAVVCDHPSKPIICIHCHPETHLQPRIPISPFDKPPLLPSPSENLSSGFDLSFVSDDLKSARLTKVVLVVSTCIAPDHECGETAARITQPVPKTIVISRNRII